MAAAARAGDLLEEDQASSSRPTSGLFELAGSQLPESLLDLSFSDLLQDVELDNRRHSTVGQRPSAAEVGDFLLSATLGLAEVDPFVHDSLYFPGLDAGPVDSTLPPMLPSDLYLTVHEHPSLSGYIADTDSWNEVASAMSTPATLPPWPSHAPAVMSFAPPVQRPWETLVAEIPWA